MCATRGVRRSGTRSRSPYGRTPGRELAAATLGVVTAVVAALEVLEIIEPVLAGTIRRALLADAELAVALLTPSPSW